MGRLPGFDYKRPFFYMVTLKSVLGTHAAKPFCSISENGGVMANATTDAFEEVFRHFHETWYCIEPIRYRVTMPDHIHLIIKMRDDVERRVSLAVVVRQLVKALEARVLQAAAPQPLFEHEWHDWIVKKEGQLAAFRKYIAENPKRHARRRASRQFFTQAREIAFQGRRYWAYGNEALLELPVIVAIKGHRSPPEAALQNRMSAAELLSASSRIGPGGAGLSTFLSPLEKGAGNAIVKAGGALIVLSMQGFGERWHPSEKQERLCAEGLMLYLSPYPPQAAHLTKREMHIRAHALVDWALEHSHHHLEAWPS